MAGDILWREVIYDHSVQVSRISIMIFEKLNHDHGHTGFLVYLQLDFSGRGFSQVVYHVLHGMGSIGMRTYFQMNLSDVARWNREHNCSTISISHCL